MSYYRLNGVHVANTRTYNKCSFGDNPGAHGFQEIEVSAHHNGEGLTITLSEGWHGRGHYSRTNSITLGVDQVNELKTMLNNIAFVEAK